MDQVKVLDHGFIKIRNISGPTRRVWRDDTLSDCQRDFDADDIDPANTARMSFDQMDSGRAREQDLALADYLMRNKHTTPFEMIEVWVEMKLPIFVARQFVRHRTCTINEVSGRYTKLPEEWYIPENVGMVATDKKQGQTGGLPNEIALWFKESLEHSCKKAYNDYCFAMENKVAPEHARLLLHLNHYTYWVWKQDIHNMMHFLSLREDSHAQVEAQLYADAIISQLRRYLPATMDLFDKYRRISAPVKEHKGPVSSKGPDHHP